MREGERGGEARTACGERRVEWNGIMDLWVSWPSLERSELLLCLCEVGEDARPVGRRWSRGEVQVWVGVKSV